MITIIVLKKELKDFDEYCQYIRGDWSQFDGRELLSNWNNLKPQIEKALLVLEIKEQYEKSIDSILNLANTIMDDSTDGNSIIKTLCDSGLELEQGKDYEWKRKEGVN